MADIEPAVFALRRRLAELEAENRMLRASVAPQAP